VESELPLNRFEILCRMNFGRSVLG